MTCISANEARTLSLQAYLGGEDVVSSVVHLITTEASRGLLHCDWYSSPKIDAGSEFIENAEATVRILERLGYKCRMEIFEPTEDFKLRRVKIHVSWEDA